MAKNSQPLTGRDNGTLSPAALPKGRERSCLRAVSPATAAVVATLHKDDVTSLRHLLRVPATYVGLIASEKRARLLLDWLGAETAAHPALHAPAGLDLGARGPEEIALSTLAEICLCRHPGWRADAFVRPVGEVP